MFEIGTVFPLQIPTVIYRVGQLVAVVISSSKSPKLGNLYYKKTKYLLIFFITKIQLCQIKVKHLYLIYIYGLKHSGTL